MPASALRSAVRGRCLLSFRKIAAMYWCFAFLACFLIASILFPALSLAQVSGGTLSGTVSDPSGGGIQPAQLVIKNVATGVERNVMTNEGGFYTAVNLLPR